MRRAPRLLLGLLLASACSAAPRGDGPPRAIPAVPKLAAAPATTASVAASGGAVAQASAGSLASAEPDESACIPLPAGPPVSSEPETADDAIADAIYSYGSATELSCLSWACLKFGLCGANGKTCFAASDAHCARSTQCIFAGECFASKGRCVARKESCRQSPNCTSKGACTVKDGRCVVTPDSCAGAPCAGDGLCTFADGACVATPSSCRASVPCKLSGKCRLRCDGQCTADTRSCAASVLCEKEARCEAVDGECVATAESCRAHKRCTEGQQCELRKGRCVGKTCRVNDACRDDGECIDAPDGSCKTDDQSCRASTRCATGGYCGSSESRGSCVATKEGCRASKRCAQDGECSLVDGFCEVASAADCKKSKRCTVDGQCKLVREGGVVSCE